MGNVKKNYFSNEQVRVSNIVRKDGKNYRIRENKLRFFFPDEWCAFFDALKKRQKITFNSLICTGSRINEIRNIRVSDIDFDRRCIILKWTKSRNKDGTRKVRVIAISSQFGRYLQKIINEYNLMPSDTFPILSTPAANIGMEKALQKAGISDWKNFSVHSVRKTTESWLMALEVDSLKVAKHIGHTIAIAEKFYVSPSTFSFEDKQIMRNVLGDIYQK